MAAPAFAAALELSTVLGDLNGALRQWCDLTEKQLAASKESQFDLLADLVGQREQLCPVISGLTLREKAVREEYSQLASQEDGMDMSLQMMQAQIEEQRAVLASLGAHAAEMDMVCANALKAQMAALGEQLDGVRNGRKASRAYSPQPRAVAARFLDKSS